MVIITLSRDFLGSTARHLVRFHGLSEKRITFCTQKKNNVSILSIMFAAVFHYIQLLLQDNFLIISLLIILTFLLKFKSKYQYPLRYKTLLRCIENEEKALEYYIHDSYTILYFSTYSLYKSKYNAIHPAVFVTIYRVIVVLHICKCIVIMLAVM